MNSTTDTPEVIAIKREASLLIGKARRLGVTLRITQEPLRPLAMGHTKTVLEAWQSRAPASSCGCDSCKGVIVHDSDCALHNLPAYMPTRCDCSASGIEQ